jgi:DHA2 family multidrug resistance protein
LSTVAFATLPAHLRTEGTAVLTLLRNIGSSIGISVVIAQLTKATTRMHANLAEFITPFNDALKAPDVASIINMASNSGRAMMEALITQQATIIAYANDFKLLMWLTLMTIPFVILIGSARLRPSGGNASEAAAAFD